MDVLWLIGSLSHLVEIDLLRGGKPMPMSRDAEPWVDLQAILNGVYDQAFYDARIDYRQPPPPPALGEANQRWLDELLAPVGV